MADAGMLQITQCTNPKGASLSSQMTTKLLVPLGAPVHFNGGEALTPLQVNSGGIGCPSENASLVSCMVICDSASFDEPPDPQAAKNKAVDITRLQDTSREYLGV